ncbi:MAG: hypothetical protein C0597_01785 [Marinilabiliales bacterium]|nr:MAG: hypothetical protein C0597_01785 [Marinilabiliales bacterium]
MKKILGRYPFGVWIAILALLLICLAWLMQMYSLLNWEGAIKLGVQDNSFMGNEIDRTLADVERAVAIADILWALPLTLIAIVGILKRKFYGLTTAMMTFAICVYFPLFYAFRESMSFDMVLAAMFLWAMPSLFGIIGLWINRKIFKV